MVELNTKSRPSCSSDVSVYFTPFPLGQFYAISFEGNVDPPSTEEEIQRVKVYLCWLFHRLVEFHHIGLT